MGGDNRTHTSTVFGNIETWKRNETSDEHVIQSSVVCGRSSENFPSRLSTIHPLFFYFFIFYIDFSF